MSGITFTPSTPRPGVPGNKDNTGDSKPQDQQAPPLNQQVRKPRPIRGTEIPYDRRPEVEAMEHPELKPGVPDNRISVPSLLERIGVPPNVMSRVLCDPVWKQLADEQGAISLRHGRLSMPNASGVVVGCLIAAKLHEPACNFLSKLCPPQEAVLGLDALHRAGIEHMSDALKAKFDQCLKDTIIRLYRDIFYGYSAKDLLDNFGKGIRSNNFRQIFKSGLESRWPLEKQRLEERGRWFIAPEPTSLAMLTRQLGVSDEVLQQLGTDARWKGPSEKEPGEIEIPRYRNVKGAVLLDLKWEHAQNMLLALVTLKQFGPACKFANMLDPRIRSSAMELLLGKGVVHAELDEEGRRHLHKCLGKLALELVYEDGTRFRDLFDKWPRELQEAIMARLLATGRLGSRPEVIGYMSEPSARAMMLLAVKAALKKRDPAVGLGHLAHFCKALKPGDALRTWLATLVANACSELEVPGLMTTETARRIRKIATGTKV